MASGGTFVTVALIKESALKILSGQPKYFRSKGDSGRWTDRGFCPACGTPMFAKGEVAAGFITIKPGTLDDPTWFKPTIDTWASSAPKWLHQDPLLPKSNTTPNVLKYSENKI
ncbi:MAG: GFA family protein [Ketobacter sp.]|nr:GFA family protein [Ketobacter sp.]